MPEPDGFRILIATPEAASGPDLVKICQNRNWHVVRVSTPDETIKALGNKTPCAYHLFMADARVTNFDLINVLTRARQISPGTKCLLIMRQMPDSEATALMLKAVNNARLESIILAGTPDNELARVAEICLEKASQDQKRVRMEQVTGDQNKQMFGIARRLKKKQVDQEERLQPLKKQRNRVSTKLKATVSQKKVPVNLESRIQAYAIPVATQALTQQFTQLVKSAEILFNNIAVNAKIDPLDVLLAKVLSGNEQPIPEQTIQQQPSDEQAFAPLKAGIIKTLYAAPETAEQFSSAFQPKHLTGNRELPDIVNISISSDSVRAFISLNACSKVERKKVTLGGILDLLRVKEIRFGIVDDQDIEAWIDTVQPGDKAFEIAQGRMPLHGQNGKINYRFETNYTNPGKINDDGHIDFKDKGSVPFVKKDDVLAKKTVAKPGKNGISIFGDTIEVDEPLDPVFLAGSGTSLSEDGTEIIAETDGHPHLDPLGEISASPGLTINGDVDFSTGNIDFNGHITISGGVKEGFCVKGVSLTAKEVAGATIDLSGELCVSDGITDTTVISVGNIYAKFINNSTAKAFGNIVIQKEIIDSQLILSGTCQNFRGTVMGSKISARNGVEAGRIGTPSSKATLIRTGVDDHIRFWKAKLSGELTASTERMQKIKQVIEALEDMDQEVYAAIAPKAQEHEKITTDIKKLEIELSQHQQTSDETTKSLARTQRKLLSARLREIDRILNQCFDKHDKNLKVIEKNKKALEKIQSEIEAITTQIKGLKEFEMRTKSLPVVLAQKSITQGTMIVGPHTSLIMETDRGRCKIQELSVNDEKGRRFELTISDP